MYAVGMSLGCKGRIVLCLVRPRCIRTPKIVAGPEPRWPGGAARDRRPSVSEGARCERRPNALEIFSFGPFEPTLKLRLVTRTQTAPTASTAGTTDNGRVIRAHFSLRPSPPTDTPPPLRSAYPPTMLSLAKQAELIKSSHAIVDSFSAWLKRKSVTHPFDPRFNTQTGRWWPAPISARREARIVLAAYRTGRLAEIPDGHKKTKMLRRIARASPEDHEQFALASDSHLLAHSVGEAEGTNGRMWTPVRSLVEARRRHFDAQLEARGAAHKEAREAGLDAAEARKRAEEAAAQLTPPPAEPVYEGANNLQSVVDALDERDIRIQQSQIIEELVSVKGPYVGRLPDAEKARTQGLRRFFKGTKQERQRPRRQKEIAANMAEMENLIKDFRAVSAEWLGGVESRTMYAYAVWSRIADVKLLDALVPTRHSDLAETKGSSGQLAHARQPAQAVVGRVDRPHLTAYSLGLETHPAASPLPLDSCGKGVYTLVSGMRLDEAVSATKSPRTAMYVLPHLQSQLHSYTPVQLVHGDSQRHCEVLDLSYTTHSPVVRSLIRGRRICFPRALACPIFDFTLKFPNTFIA